MSLSRNPDGLRRWLDVPTRIVAGGSWTARVIPNNNLRQHCHALARAFTNSSSISAALGADVGRMLDVIMKRSGILLDFHPMAFPLTPVLLRLAAYSKWWIRPPESWAGADSDNPWETIRSLIGHLFAKWRMPDCFDSAWLEKGELCYLERDWYCRLARGMSWRGMRGIPPSVTSRALHLATKAPAGLTIRQALRFGQVRAAGGSDELLAEVLASGMIRDLSNDAVWSRLIAKAATAPDFHPREYGIVADALRELTRADECRRAELLVGLPARELVAHCRRFWEEMQRIEGVRCPGWKPGDIGCRNLRNDLRIRNSQRWAPLARTGIFRSVKWENGVGSAYWIEELTSQWQLVTESRTMRHCVDTYGWDCRSGRSSVFSLRTGAEGAPTSHLTIEVARRTRRIVQVRGRRNLYFRPDGLPELREWARALELTAR